MDRIVSFVYAFFFFVGTISCFLLAYDFRETYFLPIFITMAFICFCASVASIIQMREG